MRYPIALLAASLVLLPASIDAKLYKCTGADGSVAFVDRPCREGKQEILKNPVRARPARTVPATDEDAADRVRGILSGEDFAFSGGRILKLRHYVIELQQGDGFWPEKELTVFLYGSEDEEIAGNRYEFPDPSLRQQPKLVLIWNDADGERHQKDVERGYTMSLEFGEIEGGRIDGRISVALPNRSDLSLDGTFLLDVEI